MLCQYEWRLPRSRRGYGVTREIEKGREKQTAEKVGKDKESKPIEEQWTKAQRNVAVIEKAQEQKATKLLNKEPEQRSAFTEQLRIYLQTSQPGTKCTYISLHITVFRLSLYKSSI